MRLRRDAVVGLPNGEPDRTTPRNRREQLRARFGHDSAWKRYRCGIRGSRQPAEPDEKDEEDE